MDSLVTGQEIALWPGTPPGTPEEMGEQQVHDRSDSIFFSHRGVSHISCPRLTVIRPEKPNGVAMIIAPGGGYSRITLEVEGRDIAQWFAGFGVTSFILTYRLPAEGHVNGRDVPMMDAQRAVRLVRSHAAEWGLDESRIGLVGSSAAGHMATSILSEGTGLLNARVDAIDELSARPDFGLLLYPVVTLEDPFAHADSRRFLLGADADDETIRRYSAQNLITSDAPEVFMVLADDDASVPAENAIFLYQALRRAGVRTEMHVFREGGHGFGIARTGSLPVAQWPELCAAWLKRIGMLEG
ncbi:alpha/beta hydrolase [uncultured Cohaesibacter sp.]|uniref:alpha/beta hydrolase n=1 Tax=uncultured Cohaesibacter sp. TaxID=1002546 RepID=UPI0029C89300|nr:alpha/beta hydrolase [uncultured Cohaesibacter sp.]